MTVCIGTLEVVMEEEERWGGVGQVATKNGTEMFGQCVMDFHYGREGDIGR